MTIKRASDLDGYEVETVYYPNYSEESRREMEECIDENDMVLDPVDVFQYVNHDRSYGILFESSGHERDSSGDKYFLYKLFK